MEQITTTPNYGNLYVENPSVISIDLFLTNNALKLKPTDTRNDWTEELCWLREKIRFFNIDKLTHVRSMVEGRGKLNDVLEEIY